MKVKGTPYDINITEPMSYFNIKTLQNEELEITCVSYSYEAIFKFKQFQGLEIRLEFFSPEQAYEVEIGKISNSGFNFPIYYLDYKDFEKTLTGYENMQCDDKTKKWYFLSMTNYLVLYCDNKPEVEFNYRIK